MVLVATGLIDFSSREFEKAFKQCYSKVDFDNKRVAKKEAKRLQATYHQKYNAYKCPTCKKFHTGRDKKQKNLLRSKRFES